MGQPAVSYQHCLEKNVAVSQIRDNWSQPVEM